MKTWVFELFFVATILLIVLLNKKSFSYVEVIGSLAVLSSFAHGQISDRMAERQSALVKPDVECYRWSLFYFLFKEILWSLFFILNHAYSALVGVIIFLLYPAWRKIYRRYISPIS